MSVRPRARTCDDHQRVLQQVWWLDRRTQQWLFYDPDPRFVAFKHADDG